MSECVIRDEICCGLECRCKSTCCDHNVATIKSFVNIISQKWSLKIINVLNEQECGFNELHYLLKDCARKVLTETLNNLIAKNIIVKKVYLKNNVTYSSYQLSDIGCELVRMLYQIKRFSCAYLGD
ncbi:winged helix-turn-helix transcriptional regulator [Spiroplasma endosymbiont of Stenodema calcarata]|uniref:winged helix-turn-helix transcriptional regulator n=1 Tax=Spiroplasma endosymbiont of Stenodema calcarata TaxID=3139328 RepID=UPI003CCAC7D1